MNELVTIFLLFGKSFEVSGYDSVKFLTANEFRSPTGTFSKMIFVSEFKMLHCCKLESRKQEDPHFKRDIDTLNSLLHTF